MTNELGDLARLTRDVNRVEPNENVEIVDFIETPSASSPEYEGWLQATKEIRDSTEKARTRGEDIGCRSLWTGGIHIGDLAFSPLDRVFIVTPRGTDGKSYLHVAGHPLNRLVRLSFLTAEAARREICVLLPDVEFRHETA